MVCATHNAGRATHTSQASHRPPERPFEHLMMDFLELTPADSSGLPPFFSLPLRHCVISERPIPENIVPYSPTSEHSVHRVRQQCVYYLCGMSVQQVLSSYSDDVLKNYVMVSNFVKKYQRCIRKQSATSFHHGACSLQMFKDCYKL